MLCSTGPLPVTVIVGVEPPVVHKAITQVLTGCALHCVVHGLPSKVQISKRVEFYIEARDKCGNPCSASACGMQVWYGLPPQPIKCGIVQGEDTTAVHIAWFEAANPGMHKVEVWGRRAPARLQPIMVEVMPQKVDVHNCYLEGIEGLQQCMVGQQVSFSVVVHDEAGLRVQGAQVTVDAAEALGEQIEILDAGNGVYSVCYIPQISGEGHLNVSVDGMKVLGSPVKCVACQILKSSSQRDVGPSVFVTDFY